MMKCVRTAMILIFITILSSCSKTACKEAVITEARDAYIASDYHKNADTLRNGVWGFGKSYGTPRPPNVFIDKTPGAKYHAEGIYKISEVYPYSLHDAKTIDDMVNPKVFSPRKNENHQSSIY